jgi:hypothetical protein
MMVFIRVRGFPFGTATAYLVRMMHAIMKKFSNLIFERQTERKKNRYVSKNLH